MKIPFFEGGVEIHTPLVLKGLSKTPRWKFHARIQPKAIFYMQPCISIVSQNTKESFESNWIND